MAVENPVEIYKRYVPELNDIECDASVLKKIDFCRKVLNFIISRPVGDVIFKAVVLSKFSWDSRKIKDLSDDQLLIKKGLQKELCAAAMRAGLVAATIIITVGIVIAGATITFLTGVSVIGFAVSTIGLLAPTYLMWKKDPKTAYGVIDVASLVITAQSFLAMRTGAAANLVIRFLLGPDRIGTEPTWVDDRAAKIVGFKIPKNPMVEVFY